MTNANKSKIRTRIDMLMKEARSIEERLQLIGRTVPILVEAEKILNGEDLGSTEPLPVAAKVAATAPALNPDTKALERQFQEETASVDWSNFNYSNLSGLTKVAAIAELLRYAGGPTSVADLADGAAKFGITRNKPGSNRLSAEVSATINVSPLFKRVSRGVYDLARK